ncbi:MAG: NPCBM/NEW2 domain-containing protein [Ignavibacteriaceae bacterium]
MNSRKAKINKMIAGTFAAFLIISFSFVKAQEKNFYSWAKTPPMGWNSWDCYGPTVTEKEVKENADYMAEHLKKYGWEYIVVDIRWYVKNPEAHGYNEKNPIIETDKYGRLIPAVNRFPSAKDGKGFKPLADYVHGLGLKFGIHIMRGIPKLAVDGNTPILGTNYTAKEIYSRKELCNWLHDMYTVDAAKPGAQDYYNSLFKLYATWGIDFVKVDDIASPYHKNEIDMIRKAIDNCGRPIVLSLSPGETPIEDAAHVSTHANMWRIIGDFWDNWSQLNEHFSLLEKWIPYMGPGHWPDGDMLPLGRIGIRAERGDERMSMFTRDEQYTLMSLFLICRSPLMFGGNLPDNDKFTLNLITNEDALNVLNKSKNNRLLFNHNGKIAWAADALNINDKYVALFYTSDQTPLNDKLALWNSKLITYKPGEQSTNVNVNISGAKKLYLVVTDGGNGNNWDHADWIEPKLIGKKGVLNLTDIKWKSASAGWGSATIDKSVMNNKLIVDNKEYADGIGTHATSIIEYDLPEGYDTFSSIVGLDKECVEHSEGATVRFHVYTEYPTGSSPKDSAKITLKFSELGLKGKCKVRDLWTKKELGEFVDEISLFIRKHGVKLLEISHE